MTTRSLIRDTVLKILNDKLGEKITRFKARGIPLVAGNQSSHMPAISLFIKDEKVEYFDDCYSKRTADLVVEGHLFKSIDDDGNLNVDEVDSFSDATEEVLLADESLGNTSESIRLKNVEFGLDEDAPELISFRHFYEIVYYKETKPEPKEKIPSKVFSNGERLES